jgi:hypothetical protein
MREKQIGVIGLGVQGQRILSKLEKIAESGSGFKISCLYDLFPEKCKAKGNVRVTSDFRELVDNTDIVFIATPTKYHFEAAEYALSRGKDVFVEKPACEELPDFGMLLKRMHENNAKLYVSDPFIHMNEYTVVKKHARESNPKRLCFEWVKYGTFNERIIPALVYHDMYIMMDMFGFDPHKMHDMQDIKIKEVSDKVQNQFVNIFRFAFGYKDVDVECFYNRTVEEKSEHKKIITMEDSEGCILEWKKDSHVKIGGVNQAYEKNDALFDIVHNFLHTSDFYENNMMALRCLYLCYNLQMEKEAWKSRMGRDPSEDSSESILPIIKR